MPRLRPVFLLIVAASGFCAAEAEACTVSAIGVAFGIYDPGSLTPDDSTGTINLACSPSVQNPLVQLGTGSSGNYTTRTLVSGPYTLNYNLYTTAAYAVIWGNGTGGSSSVTLSNGTLSKGTRSFSSTIYGRITAAQNPGAGVYSDTVVVTVVF